MRRSGISQADFQLLASKTNMERVEELAREHGVKKYRQFVNANLRKHKLNDPACLAKSSTTVGITTGLDLVFIDLRAPAYMLDPIYTPIRNSTPRWDKVNAGYGVQPQWHAVTSIDATNQFPGVSEGNTNANGSFTNLNFSSPYVTLGTDDFVTYESQSAGEGYEDVLGDGKMWELMRFVRMQERTYLGGAGTGAANGALQLQTTNTPVGVLSALNNTSYVTGVLPVGSYAAAYAVGLNYRAVTNPVNTISAGITTQYLRTNADGSSDVINGGTAIVSGASNVVGPTVSGTKTIQFSCTPQTGYWGYAWFVQINTSTTFSPAASSAKLSGITSASTFNYFGQTQGTQTAAYAGTGGYAGFATDLSTNALDMDGLLTIASNSNYTTGLPTWTYPVNGSQTALAGGVDLHGAGLTNGGMVGSVAEIDNVLFATQQANLSSPTRIYLSTDQVQAFTLAFMVGSTTGTTINFFKEMGSGDGVEVNNIVTRYYNRFALGEGAWIDVIQHPYLPKGTIFFDVDRLGVAYENSRLGETRGVFVRRDTYGIEFAQTSRKLPFGVFSEEVLAVKTPQLLGYIKGAGAFGATALF